MIIDSIFPTDKNPEKYNLIFIAAFHLGVPLAICQTPHSTGWPEIREEFSEIFAKNSQVFEVPPIEFVPEIKFPLGKPFIIKHSHFFTVFNLLKFLENEGVSLNPEQYELEHYIWILPSGIVLLLGKLSLFNKDTVSREKFDFVVENHYSELTFIFTEVAEVIIQTLPNKILSSSVCCRADIEKSRRGIPLSKVLSKSGIFINIPNYALVLERLINDAQVRTLYDDILIDVYYIDFWHHEDKSKPRPYREKECDKLQIDYVDASIESSDPMYALMIAIGFSGFVGLLWLQKQLGEQAQYFQKTVMGATPASKDISELKLFRIFCLQFIQESRPISIRLTRRYMISLETFWNESRLHTLVEQVNEQLETLEEMFEWIDDAKKEEQNAKLGLAGVLLASISMTAVAAQLISTLDGYSGKELGVRIFLILLGFFIGCLATIGLYLLPISRLLTRSKIAKTQNNLLTRFFSFLKK